MDINKGLNKENSSEIYSSFVGESIGTFILVFFGCGATAVTVLFSSHSGLFQIAALWGIGVSLAVYSTRYISCAHLNPAVSFAMVVAKRMTVKKLPIYLVAQFFGAFIAAAVLYVLLNSSIVNFEMIHGIQRGNPDSNITAMIFGEFYPNPGIVKVADVTMWNAFIAESIGTFALVFFIFSLTEGCNVGRPDDSLTPLFIGSAVTLIISIIAPLTQAGLNPARDLSPRLFAFMAGWGTAAFPDNNYGFLIVYVAGPVCGAILAALLFRIILEPLMIKNEKVKGCNCANIEDSSNNSLKEN
ncbi:MAG: aquaporin [Desulfobacula sp.]|nr:aquaporin [Desulfobacula sp.]